MFENILSKLFSFPYSFFIIYLFIFLAPSNARKPNQDSFLMKHDLKSSALVIACFDGHGQYGHDVSRFCKNYLEAELVSHPLFLSNLSMAITEVIYALGEGMCVYI